MIFPYLIIRALVEGVATILPVDAHGHGQLATRLLGWQPGPIDIAINLGTALALLIYYWRDINLIAKGVWRLRKRRLEPGTILLGKILLAGLPVVFLSGWEAAIGLERIANLVLAGIVTLFAALIMLIADRACLTVKRIEHIGWATSLSIGAAQLLGFLPGVGRMAASLTVARITGLERPDGFRFVLLSSIPYLLVTSWRKAVAGPASLDAISAYDGMAVGVTFLVVLVALHLTTLWLRRGTLLPFALYRLAIGILMITLGVAH